MSTEFNISSSALGEGIEAVQAVPDDTPRVTDLLTETARWLQSRGSGQWSGLLRGEDSHRTPEAIRRGEVFLFEADGRLAGMLMLLPQPSAWDRALWGERGHEGAVYLHRLAVSREFAGRSLGGRMLEWAVSGIRFRGQNRVRLDCMADNPTLNAFYRRMGFAYAGEAAVGAGLYSKFEKPAAAAVDRA